jgi:N-acetylglucosamine-6-phosphate deacetylase
MDPHLADGVYSWRDGSSINKCGARITLEGTDTLAGSAVTLDECVRNLSLFASIPLSQAILCASTNAAKSLGDAVSSHKGLLAADYDADLSVWDRQTGQVKAAWVSGKLAFSSETL